MELRATLGDITKVEADAIVVNLFEGVTRPTGATGAINTVTDGLITEHIKTREFEGKETDALILHAPPGVKAKHIIVMGLGKQADFSPVTVRKISAKSIQKARELKAKHVATIPHGAGAGGLAAASVGQAMAEGLLLGNYLFTRYKTKEKDSLEKEQIASVTILESDGSKIESLEEGIAKGTSIAVAVNAARDLINESPSKVKPATLVQEARDIAASGDAGSIHVTALDREALRQEGYTALLAVSAGSEEEPYLIHLHYKPKKPKGSIAFIGKGVTFDSGGLGIKPWSAMRTMKSDMAGAAAVLGIFRAINQLQAVGQSIPYEVHGVIPTTENMISGRAMRPDDIIETKSGKTIEVAHTDAEGRLILSDALTYATRLAPQSIIDYATLTGAAIRALGRHFSACMGNDRTLMDFVLQAGNVTGELAWELPLHKEYSKYLESSVADMQNIGKSDSSPDAIIGGLFLQEFVEHIPWVHIDIAGPSWQEEDTNPAYPKGATGYGILLGLQVLDLLTK